MDQFTKLENTDLHGHKDNYSQLLASIVFPMYTDTPYEVMQYLPQQTCVG